jgi:hypothetical protein
MRTRRDEGAYLSPTRLLEMLEFRFGAFEAIACAALELARKDPDDKLPMDVRTADAILEFGDDLRQASRAAASWSQAMSKPTSTRTLSSSDRDKGGAP